MSRFFYVYGEPRVRLDPWDTLDDLRELLGLRCSPEHFAAAVTMMGTDPYSVASYLFRHGYFVTLQPEADAPAAIAPERAEDLDVR